MDSSREWLVALISTILLNFQTGGKIPTNPTNRFVRF